MKLQGVGLKGFSLVLLLLFSSHASAWFKTKRELTVDVAVNLPFLERTFVSGRIDAGQLGNQVELWDADLNLLIATTTVRRHHYRFALNESPHSTLPCKVEVRAGGKSLAKRVRRASNRCGQHKLTLTGLVTDGPIPYAEVVASIGERRFTTNADELGVYQLTVLSRDLQALLQLDANATDASNGQPIHLASLVGTFERAQQWPSQNVTNVTSAALLLMSEANGGQTPTTAEQFATAEAAVDAQQLLQLAAIIKLLVDDPRFVMPEGYNDPLLFVADEAALQQFIAEVKAVDAEAIDNAVAAIVADPNLVAGFSVDQIPDRYIVVDVANPGYLARSGSVLEFDSATQQGELLSLAVEGQPLQRPFSWLVSDGRLQLNFAQSLETQGISYDIHELTEDPAKIAQFYAAGGTPNGDGIWVFDNVTSQSFQRLSEGQSADIVVTEVVTERRIPEFTLADGSVMSLPNRQFSASRSQRLRSDVQLQAGRFSSDCSDDNLCPQGRWGALLHYQPGINVYSRQPYADSAHGDVLQLLADGTAIGVISGLVASWQVDDGSLVISYSDGWQQRATIADKVGAEYGVISEFQRGAERFVGYSIWVKGQDELTLSSGYLANLQPQQYWNGEVNAWIPSYLDEQGNRAPNSYFGWKFADGMTLSNRYSSVTDSDGDGTTEVIWTIQQSQGWQQLADRLQLDRFSFAQRFWLPLATAEIDGERVFYVMEWELRDAQLQFGGEPGWHLLFPPRINIQREIDQLQQYDLLVENPAF